MTAGSRRIVARNSRRFQAPAHSIADGKAGIAVTAQEYPLEAGAAGSDRSVDPAGRGDDLENLPVPTNTLWRVRLFDGPRLESPAGDTIVRFKSQRVGALLAYLALKLGHPCPREEIAFALWPEDEDTQAVANRLRVALASLRRQMEPPGTTFGSVLDVSHPACIRLRSETVWCASGTFFPSRYSDSGQYPIYLNALMGTFTDSAGTIVGTPFATGNGPFNVTVPAGATQLQLGINDDVYSDNSGSLNIRVSAAPVSDVPEPGSIALLMAGIGGAALLRRKRARRSV